MPRRNKSGLDHLLHPTPKESPIPDNIYFQVPLYTKLRHEWLQRKSKERRVSKSQIVNEALAIYFAMPEEERKHRLGQEDVDDL